MKISIYKHTLDVLDGYYLRVAREKCLARQCAGGLMRSITGTAPLPAAVYDYMLYGDYDDAAAKAAAAQE